MSINRVKVLDCTLRDGGYINNWLFGYDTISSIIEGLIEAHIDIIECGFIRNVSRDNDSSVFSNMGQLSEMITPKNKDVLYAVMIEQHNYVAELISPCDDNTADIIRLTFRRNEWEEAKITARELIAKGYKVCIQPVGTASYDDPSLIKLLQDVNELKPYAFYLVDTLGVMYRHEMRRFFYLIDNNLSKSIILGFHSHNNLQMSFANAQEMMRLNRDRNLIIDSSCYGMGRGVGNLATELLTDYLNNSNEQKYSLTPLINIVDKYLMPIYSHTRWGYDLPYFLSAIFKCHPNYAAHLLRKETLGIEKIEKLLSLIPEDKRNEYKAELIEKLYLELQSFTIDDSDAYECLQKKVEAKEIVIMAPGTSVQTYKDIIDEKNADGMMISVNFIPDNYNVGAVFISNDKRVGSICDNNTTQILATSNLKNSLSNALFFDYSSLLGEGEASDNAGAMLIRILKKCKVNKLLLAGFDGFDVDASTNYTVDAFKTALDYDTAQRKNEEISKQLSMALEGINYEVITPTKYKIGNI
ncbi:MAG: aldolase catalytic domain-containing protein [Butyrivibrio sp.]|uniref:aldolase catalytic domain-containing protein n=1 Tax=Butyrivibrio sp. TaxID=28121 RepID=UPI0025DAD069|nr:aldolase catalytic domain-containing protein [Butyrivibrio sp.]MCR5772844.1 aldolase catalytic domain-containing protein [Butyrivibrio sp.]